MILINMRSHRDHEAIHISFYILSVRIYECAGGGIFFFASFSSLERRFTVISCPEDHEAIALHVLGFEGRRVSLIDLR